MKILSPELAEKARVELNEVQSEVPGQIQALRDKILENPNFNFRTNDIFLLKFLRARKYNQERALELVINYYKQRERFPEIFRKLPSSGLETCLNSNIHAVLPNRDTEGRAVAMNMISNWNPSDVSTDDIITQTLLSGERLTEEDEIQINGVVYLIDMKGFNLNHLWHITPMALRKGVSILLSSFPVRIKAIHFINKPLLFDALFFLVKPFLSKKLLSRISVHDSSFERLHQAVSPEILPEELGGHLEAFSSTEWNAVLKSFEEFAKNNLSYGLLGKERMDVEMIDSPIDENENVSYD